MKIRSLHKRARLIAFTSTIALVSLFVTPETQAQIDRELVRKALHEGQQSDPQTRRAVEGTLGVYERLPKAIAGGDKIPAKPGHPLGKSPLVSDTERQRSKDVVMPLMTIFRGADHKAREDLLRSSQMFEKHMRTMPAPRNLNEKYGHIKKCPACAAHVAHMIYQHEEAVASAPVREIALFNYGESKLTRTAVDRIHRFVDHCRKQPDARICLIGRASRKGGNWQTNQSLSERRTDAVASELRHHGIPASSITTLWLGFDAPQLCDENSAKYGFSRLWRDAGVLRMNQSVLMVMYLETPPLGSVTEVSSVVASPHPPYRHVDVSGFKSGDTVIDPISKKAFIVP